MVRIAVPSITLPHTTTGLSPCHRITLSQVSVAVLLDNFINYTIKVEEEEKRKERAEQRSRAEVPRKGEGEG